MKEISAGKWEHGPYYPDAMWPGHKASQSPQLSAEVIGAVSSLLSTFSYREN
jgi:hypothetical protein